MADRAACTAFSGTRASYVALSSCTTLGLALMCSIWAPDVSGTIALLGLLAVYMASQEMLLLFVGFAPASIVVDIVRLAHVAPSTSGRGWLIFFSLLGMLAKAVGSLFAWSLYRSISTGEGGGAYSPVGHAVAAPTAPTTATSYGVRAEDPFAAAYAPPPMAHNAYQPSDHLRPPAAPLQPSQPARMAQAAAAPQPQPPQQQPPGDLMV